jgi:hypothetical protein
MNHPCKEKTQQWMILHQHVILRSKRQLHQMYLSCPTIFNRFHPATPCRRRGIRTTRRGPATSAMRRARPRRRLGDGRGEGRRDLAARRFDSAVRWSVRNLEFSLRCWWLNWLPIYGISGIAVNCDSLVSLNWVGIHIIIIPFTKHIHWFFTASLK